MGTIRIRVESDVGEGPAREIEPGVARGREIREGFGAGGSRVVPFDTAELAASLRGLTGQLGELFGGLRDVGGFELQQVQVGLEVSAEGGFNLIGSAKAGGKGAITLTFQPSRPASGATSDEDG
jgi:hypothetical protein